jgi:hypothetical protein
VSKEIKWILNFCYMIHFLGHSYTTSLYDNVFFFFFVAVLGINPGHCAC